MCIESACCYHYFIYFLKWKCKHKSCLKFSWHQLFVSSTTSWSPSVVLTCVSREFKLISVDCIDPSETKFCLDAKGLCHLSPCLLGYYWRVHLIDSLEWHSHLFLHYSSYCWIRNLSLITCLLLKMKSNII